MRLTEIPTAAETPADSCIHFFDAARYLHLPQGTIRNRVWISACDTCPRARQAKPLIDVECGASHDFSFFNLIELHVLGAFRRGIACSCQRFAVRSSSEARARSPRPLIDENMETDGLEHFVRLGQLINVSENGNRDGSALQAHLKRIDRDADGVPIRLFPFTRARSGSGKRAGHRARHESW